MRKLLAVAVMALSLVAVVRTASFAQTSISISTITATATFTGAGSVNMSYAFVTLTGGTTTTQNVWWNPAGINLGTTAWKSADVCLKLTTTMTALGGAIRIYTDNVNPAGSPVYGYGVQTSSNSPNDPEGLVCVSTNTRTLPMCWRVNTSTVVPAINQGTYSANVTPALPGRLYDANTVVDVAHGHTPDEYPCYLWMMDKSSANFNPYNLTTYGSGTSGVVNNTYSPQYSIVRDSMLGIQHAEATWGSAGSPVYVYLGANFLNAVTSISGVTYKTTLQLEAYYE